jgi:pimeloyl-ACP methyl ester carboxylesterase
LRSDPKLEYLLCVPENASPGGPLLVAVLGHSSRWMRQASLLVPLCARYGLTLLAPSMAAHRFYRRVGRDDERADFYLHDCLREVGHITGVDTSCFYLVGHAGGAQFAHRYAMASPHRVKAAVFAATPWWSMPDPARGFPYGTRRSRRLAGVSFNPEHYLRLPMTAVVPRAVKGSEPPVLNEKIAAQGASRIERAQAWTNAMREQALAFGMQPRVVLSETAAPSYRFEDFCRTGSLLDIIALSVQEDLEAGARACTDHPGVMQ